MPKRGDAMRGLLWVVIGTAAACSKYANVPCERDINCDLASGGVCTASEIGNRWCAYPDPACPGGYRYSTQAVGDGVSGTCVAMPDAGIDNLPDWIVRHGGDGDDYGNGIAAAPNGDLVMVGGFAGTVSFGGAALASGPGWVARYRADGSHVWSKTIGVGASAENVAIDRHGDVYVLGGIVGSSADLGGGVRTVNNGKFVVKLAGETGDYVWDRVIEADGGAELDLHPIITAGDNVALCGAFRGTIDLGAGPQAATGSLDNFVAVYDTATGRPAWSHVLTTSGEDNSICNLIAVDDDVVVTADFAGTATLGGAPLVGSGLDNMLVARYRGSDGTLVWLVGHGGSGMAEISPTQIASDGQRVFVGGALFGSVNLGGLDLSPPAGSGGSGNFAAAYHVSDGSHAWSELVGDGHGEIATMTATATQLAVGISFEGTLTLGSSSFMSVGSNLDVALARLNPATGSLGAAVTNLGSATPGARVSVSLAYTADRLAGVGTFQSTLQVIDTKLTSVGGQDVVSFRIDF
jgi:hypothetical protein